MGKRAAVVFYLVMLAPLLVAGIVGCYSNAHAPQPQQHASHCKWEWGTNDLGHVPAHWEWMCG